jgi:U3 small nucleolar RNA-associated protein 18
MIEPKRKKQKVSVVIESDQEIDEDELLLEEKVFGIASNTSFEKVLSKVGADMTAEEDLGFYIDNGQSDSAEESKGTEENAAAWEDDEEQDDVDIQSKLKLRKLKQDYTETKISSKQLEKRLRAQYEKLHPTPNWATGLAQETDIFQTSTRLIDTQVLDKDKLNVTRVENANIADPSKTTILGLKFHPTANVIITAGLDKTLRLFQVNGKENLKIKSYFFKDLPIFSADFINSKEILVTGRRNFFYVVDLKTEKVQRINSIRGRDEKSFERASVTPCGKYIVILGVDGYVLFLSSRSKQLVGQVKLNSTCVSVCYTNGSIWTLGRDGDVYQWDIESKQCLYTFKDQGNIKATTIETNGKYLAIGSISGIVNLYLIDSLKTEFPEPEKVFMNLTTSVTTIKFHPIQNIMAIASNELKDSMRIVNLQTKTVFKNWPTERTPLGYVSQIEFSHDGQYVSVGNDKGKVLLYRLEDFIP